jgi:hypothetical protein
MALRIRKARPGTWHHVYNRGIGKRMIWPGPGSCTS